uniref:Ig-like domain-containing protein n=1 Tax=Lygus hesperus TaxID=30085 RepID=A0A0K8S5V9_LYGHE
MPAHPIPQPVEPPPTGNIIYVAEAHATHRANVNTLSTKSDFFESSQQQSEVVTETNITPAEAKKIWTAPPVESPKPIPKQEFKPVKIPSPAVPVDDGIRLEPGPPPEIAFATPPPAEGVRRQSYVEMMEHEIEKDLDKEPTKRLVGAVRTIPPPPLKRESSVESQKSIHMEKSLITTNKVERRANSFCDESFKSFPVLEPFPFKPEQGSPSPVKCSTLPRPSKFKKQCTESDYESDLEGSRIKPRWTPIHSDTEDPHYRKVKPPSSSGQPKRAQSEQPEAPPPSLYSSPPVTFSTRVTSSSESFMQSKQIQMKSQESRQIKQSESSQQETVQLKPGSPPQYLQTKPESQFQQSKPESPKIKKRPTPTDSGYMADTDEPRISRQKTTSHRIEKSIVQHSTFKQEKKTASSGQYQDTTQQVSSSTFQSLEPFPFKPSVVSEMPSPKVPLASPSKFTKGEFRESDYESDYEKSARIPPIWTPTQSGFKPVVKPQFSPAPAPAFEAPKPKFEPIEKQTPASTVKILRPQPQHFFDLKPGSPPEMRYAPPLSAVETSNSMSFAESTASSHRVVSVQQRTQVINFEQKQGRQASLPSKIVPKGEAKWLSDSDSEVKSAVEVKAEEKRLQRVEEMRRRFSGEKSQSLMDLKPGEPPQFDYAPPIVPPAAATVANKHISEMTSTFKSKAQQFVSDIVTDVKQNGHVPSLSKPAPMAVAKQENGDPHVYREESRLAEHGTKCIDPDTGLIYFKYDFGYEFGVVLPGEGGKPGSSVKAKAITTSKPSEREDGSIEVPVIHETTASAGTPSPFGQSKKKKQQHKSVKWDPTSESEMSDLEEARRKGISQGPRISYPNTPSPLSASPAPSPYTAAGHDQGAPNWASSASPLSSPVVVNAMLHSESPKKPPVFITPLRDIAVVSGLTARFECIVQSEPPPSISWSKDGRIIEPSLNHEIQFRNGVCRLTIPQAYNYDAGDYSCTATNHLGSQITSATLQVTGEARTYISK